MTLQGLWTESKGSSSMQLPAKVVREGGGGGGGGVNRMT